MKPKRKTAFSAEVFGALVHTVTRSEYDAARNTDDVHVVQPQRRAGASDD